MTDSIFKTEWLSGVNRLEVIDASGRSYANWKVKDIEFSLQDNNRTLKVFVSETKDDQGRDTRID